MPSADLPQPSVCLRLSYPTYFETLAPPHFARLSTWMGMGVLAVAAASLGFLRWREPALLGTFTPLGACIAVVPLAMKGIYSILLSWIQYLPTFVRLDPMTPAEFERWVREEFERFLSSPIPRHFGIGYAAFAVIVFWRGGAFERLPTLVLVLCLVLTLAAGFVCGVGLVGICYLGRFIWLLGRRYAVRVAVHGYGVLSTGTMLVKCYGVVAVVWCLCTSSATWSLAGRWIPLLALAAPAAVFFVSSFVACQFPLHRRMVECKRAALLELDNLLERLTPRGSTDMSEERQRQVDFCMAQSERVRKWPEWPFSIGNLSGIMGASMAAIAPQIIQALLPLAVKHSR